MIANAHLLDDTPMIDLFDADRTNSIATFGPGFMTVTVPAETVLVLQPRERDHGGYSRYKRVP